MGRVSGTYANKPVIGSLVRVAMFQVAFRDDIMQMNRVALTSCLSGCAEATRLCKLKQERILRNCTLCKLEQERILRNYTLCKLEHERIVQDNTLCKMEHERIVQDYTLRKLEPERIVTCLAIDRVGF